MGCCICKKEMDFFSSRKFIEGEQMCEECKARLKLMDTKNSSNIQNIISTRRKLIDFMEDPEMEPAVREELRKRIEDTYAFTNDFVDSNFKADRDEEYKRAHPKYTSEQKYEYKIETVSDSSVLGKIQVEEMENILRKYAQEGWRLHTALTNEMGKNAVVGVNATVNQTIFIFERDVIHEVEDDSEDGAEE